MYAHTSATYNKYSTQVRNNHHPNLYNGGFNMGRVTCNSCHGMGTIVVNAKETCPTCDGSGNVLNKICSTCHGMGSIRVATEVQCGSCGGSGTV
jgi:DnaJ-class molecular chaperone